MILLLLWNIATSPAVLKSLFKSDFIQAISAIATSAATIALWVVTGRLNRATRIQVHSVTAPLILSQIYLRNDPAESQEIENAFLLPLYEFGSEDAAEPEINAYHVQHGNLATNQEAARVTWNAEQDRRRNLQRDAQASLSDLGPEPELPQLKRYVVVRVFNVQAASAYGLALDIEIDTVLTFPRYSFSIGSSGASTCKYDSSLAIEVRGHERKRSIAA